MSILQQTDIWGPPTWYLLHLWSFGFRKTNYLLYKDVFNLLGKYIPCTSCRKHYNEYRKIHPIHWEHLTRDDFIEWILNFHNSVNKRLKKPIWTLEKLKNNKPKWNKKIIAKAWIIYAQWILYHNKNMKPFAILVKATMASHPDFETSKKALEMLSKFNKWSSIKETNKFIAKLIIVKSSNKNKNDN